MHFIKKISPSTIYFVCSISGIVLFLMVALFEQKTIFDWVAMENNSDWAGLDYFRHIVYAMDRQGLYTHGVDACFPPLAYMFYYYIGRISGGAASDYHVLAQMPYQNTIFLIYSIVGILILVYAIEELNILQKQKRLLTFSLVFSIPIFWGALERGNMALYVVAFLLLAFVWKDSESKVKREAALFLIAVSAGLKIYPAFMGLLYVKEKRYKEALRLVCYGIVLFFTPFIFFGGIQGVRMFLGVIRNLSITTFLGRIQFFQGLLTFIGIQGMEAVFLNYIFLFVLVFLMFFTKSKIREITYMSAIMTFFPAGAYRYTLAYFILSVFALFRYQKNKSDYYISSVFLGLLFSIPTIFGLCTNFQLSCGMDKTATSVEYYIYSIAWSYLIYCIIMEIVCYAQRKQNAKGGIA